MKRMGFLLGLALLNGVTGCSFLPEYQPAQNEKMVPIRVMWYGSFSMCRDGKRYQLPIRKSDANNVGVIYVPSGKPIGLSVYMSQDGYQRIYYCMPALSFDPVPDQAYVENNGTYQGRCFIELVKQDDSKDTGVSLDNGVRPYSCGQ